MPQPIQKGDPALQLSRAYNLKGKLPLLLDEVIVPVHIVGSLSPDDPSVGEAPSTAERGILRSTSPSPGAGNHSVFVVQLEEPGADFVPHNVFIEIFRLTNGGSGGFQWGIGLATGVAGALSGPVPALPLARPGESSNSMSINLRAWWGAFPTATPVGAVMDDWINNTGGTDRDISPGVVLGFRRSAPYWLDGAVPLVPGNAEFWVRSNTVNSPFGIVVRASILDI